MTAEGTPVARKFDPVSAMMALIASIAIVWAGWLRFGPPPTPEPLSPGAKLPALRLIDPETNESVLLLGLRNKVVWVTFWSSTASEANSDLIDLERIWSRFKDREKFAMAAVAVDEAKAGRLLALVAKSKVSLPVYLAAPETRQRFGADAAKLPLHLLVDETGRVAAVAQGREGATLARLAEQARQRLDKIDPIGNSRFVKKRNAFIRR